MPNRYQSFSFTTASIASAATLQASQTLGPHVYNLVKLKIVRVTGNGNINFRIFKKGVWGSANRLIRFENQTVPLLQPVDQTSGAPGVEALEGVPLPVDDEDGTNFDGTGKLHYELENLGTTSTFTISGEYEEVVVLDSSGNASWRGYESALNSLQIRGTASGVVTIAAGAAAAGTWTLKLPTTGGTSGYLLSTDGAGVTSWVAPPAGISGLTAGRVAIAASATTLTDDADLTFSGDTLTATKLLSPTSISSPSHISTGAITITPNAGSNLNVALSTTGDLVVNTNQLVVDTSASMVGIGTATPGFKLDVNTNAANYIASFTGGNSGAFVIGNAGTNTINLQAQSGDSLSLETNGSVTPAILITVARSVILSAQALATNATDGFTYIPTCAGTPTGVPSAQTGTVAIVYDTTNNKLYAYNAAWKSVTLA